jgi:hypothetical protein
MARSPVRGGGDFGPLGNAPRDRKDDVVGVPAEEIKTGEPPRWPPNPKKVKKNDFHAKVSGKAARARADRAPHFRRGGFVQGRKHGGATGPTADEEPFKKKGAAFEQDAGFRRGGHVRKHDSGGNVGPNDDKDMPATPSLPSYQFGGGVNPNRVHTTVTKTVPHGGALRHRVTASRTVSRDPVRHPLTGRPFERGGKVKKRAAGGVAKFQDGGSMLADDLKFAEQGTGAGSGGSTLGNVGSAVSKALTGVQQATNPQQQQQKCTPLPPIPAYPKHGGTIKKRASGGHITTAERKALPSGDFALPGKGKGAGGKGPGSYPIDTADRARSALSRGEQHASSGELATIRRKIKAKYPGMDVEGD